jgi:hypothetical protein
MRTGYSCRFFPTINCRETTTAARLYSEKHAKCPKKSPFRLAHGLPMRSRSIYAHAHYSCARAAFTKRQPPKGKRSMSPQITTKEIRKQISSLLALSIFVTALGAPLARAHCEAERNQWQEFKRNCDASVAASGAAAVGGAIAIPIFGGLLGLIPGLVGQISFSSEKRSSSNRTRSESMRTSMI